MQRPEINMMRPTALYLAIIATLLLLTFVIDRLPLLSVAQLLNLPYSKAIAGGVLCLSIVFGLLGAQRLAARARTPWKVPQSQSLILFLLFLVTALSGLALSI